MPDLLETAILELLAARRPGASACPSEVARRVAPDDWRAWMDPVRAAAGRLAARGAIEVLQRGRPVEIGARGPIRLRLRGGTGREELRR